MVEPRNVFVKLSFEGNQNVLGLNEFQIPCSTFVQSLNQAFMVEIDNTYLASVIIPLFFKLMSSFLDKCI